MSLADTLPVSVRERVCGEDVLLPVCGFDCPEVESDDLTVPDALLSAPRPNIKELELDEGV